MEENPKMANADAELMEDDSMEIESDEEVYLYQINKTIAIIYSIL